MGTNFRDQVWKRVPKYYRDFGRKQGQCLENRASQSNQSFLGALFTSLHQGFYGDYACHGDVSKKKQKKKFQSKL